MTTFNGTKSCQDHALEIRGELCGEGRGPGIALITTVKGKNNVTVLDPADDAAIALAVMDAARRGEESSWDLESAAYARQTAISWLMTARDRTAEEADTTKREAERDRRRDELAPEVEGRGFTYIDLCVGTKRAVDMIIDRDDRIADLENQE